jgi:hypothetical protein
MLLLLFGIAAPAFAEQQGAVSIQVQVPSRQQVWMKHRATTWNTEHRTWEQRGGYQGYRVPDDQFTLKFGTENTFRINSLPYRMVNDQASFQYNGYWMNVVDPWPETWADGWYDSDDVYVRYDNGYYLYNSKHPDARLSLQFSM